MGDGGKVDVLALQLAARGSRQLQKVVDEPAHSLAAGAHPFLKMPPFLAEGIGEFLEEDAAEAVDRA